MLGRHVFWTATDSSPREAAKMEWGQVIAAWEQGKWGFKMGASSCEVLPRRGGMPCPSQRWSFVMRLFCPSSRHEPEVEASKLWLLQ